MENRWQNAPLSNIVSGTEVINEKNTVEGKFPFPLFLFFLKFLIMYIPKN